MAVPHILNLDAGPVIRNVRSARRYFGCVELRGPSLALSDDCELLGFIVGEEKLVFLD